MLFTTAAAAATDFQLMGQKRGQIWQGMDQNRTSMGSIDPKAFIEKIEEIVMNIFNYCTAVLW